MIKLDRVQLLHWDMQPHQVLPLSSGVTLITGENGSGKTSILDAIKVGLGVTRLDGDRSIDTYLGVQSRPVAMIRILVDNRPEPGTRRRPFDPLGEHNEDVITLAVVFRAEDQGHYRRDYFILDGDVVPLPEAGTVTSSAFKPLPGPTEYRARLMRVGIGEQYLKLLSLPQGQIASLCKKAGAELFDAVYDIIGGRDALEAWKARRSDLSEKKREHDVARREVEVAERNLDQLREKVRRFHEYRDACRQLKTIDEVVPHARLAAAATAAEQLAQDVDALERELDTTRKSGHDAQRDGERIRDLLGEISGRRRALTAEKEDVGTARDQIFARLARGQARFDLLDALRNAADGTARCSLDDLHGELEGGQTTLVEGLAIQRERDERRRGFARQLEQVSRGILPYPPEVDAFRDELRRRAIPHHVLAEVLEVEDDAWTRPLEAFLGRYRFAILVQDPESWEQVAMLAREQRYPHGVLAPDVRSWSATDNEGLGALVKVREPRYEQLIARLLRRVHPEEPPMPLEPPPRDERYLAPDGFVVSRIEVYVPPAEHLFLGRRALEERRRWLESAIHELDEQRGEWEREEGRLRLRARELEREIEAQNRLRRWDEAREEHASLREENAALEERHLALVHELKTLEGKLETDRLQEKELDTNWGQVEERLRSSKLVLGKLDARLGLVRTHKAEADKQLGELRAGELPTLSADASEMLEQASSLEMLLGQKQALESSLSVYRPDERDELIPRNYERQKGELDAVSDRLDRLRDALDETEEAARDAQEHYHQTTRRIFRAYFNELAESAGRIDFTVSGALQLRDSGTFSCEIKVQVGQKAPVHHDSDKLSGGEKAALSILMGMTAVSLESEGAGFFLIDEPFSQSDVHKINELGNFLARTRAQYLVSMPTSADLDQCGPWLQAVWTCTKSRGGYDGRGEAVLAAPVKLSFAIGARADA